MRTNMKSRNILNPRGLSLCEDFDLSSGNEVDWTDTMSDMDANAEIDYMRGMSLSLRSQLDTTTASYMLPPKFSDDVVKGLEKIYDNSNSSPASNSYSYVFDRDNLMVYKAMPGIIMDPQTFIMGAPEADFNGMMRESKMWGKYFGKMNVTPEDRFKFISDCVMSLPPQQAIAKNHILSVMPDVDIDCGADEQNEFEFSLANSIFNMICRKNTHGAVHSWTGYTEVFAPAADKWFGFFITEADAFDPDGYSSLSDINVFGSTNLTNMFNRIPSEFEMEKDDNGRYKLFYSLRRLSDYVLEYHGL